MRRAVTLGFSFFFSLYSYVSVVNSKQLTDGCVKLNGNEFIPVPQDRSYWPDTAPDDAWSEYIRLKDLCIASAPLAGLREPPSYNCCPPGAKEPQCTLPRQWGESKRNRGEKMIALCQERCWCQKTEDEVQTFKNGFPGPSVEDPEDLEDLDLDRWNAVVEQSIAASYASICPPPEPCSSQQECADSTIPDQTAAQPSGVVGNVVGACRPNTHCPNLSGSNGNGASSSRPSPATTRAVCTTNQMCAAVPRPRLSRPISAAQVAAALTAGVRISMTRRVVGRCVPKGAFNKFNGKRDISGPACYCNGTFVHQECCDAQDGKVWNVKNFAYGSELLL